MDTIPPFVYVVFVREHMRDMLTQYNVVLKGPLSH